jgi:chromate transporter
MIFLDLFLGFLKVGSFTFGGGYAAIPLVRDVVLSYGWLSEEELTYMIAIAESTPGPIMVNLATYVGSAQGGILGAALATLAVVLPSFFIIILVISILKNFLNSPAVQAVLRGLKPCVVGIILATGATMTLRHCFPAGAVDISALLITALLFAVIFLYEKLKKKKISPIMLIVVSALLGMLLY